jgi:general secretion pathway protein J
MHKHSRHIGFTLLEVVIALAIFSLISIAAYRGVDSLLRAKQSVQAENRKWQEIMLFFDRFELDIKQHVNRPVSNDRNQIEPAWFATPERAGAQKTQLRFTRSGEKLQAGYLMDSRRISYRLSNGNIELLFWPALDITASSQPEIFIVLKNVRRFNLKYLNPQGAWLEFWPEPNSQDKNRLYHPKALQLELTMGSGEVIKRLFTL